jgi:hypothetical protein
MKRATAKAMARLPTKPSNAKAIERAFTTVLKDTDRRQSPISLRRNRVTFDPLLLDHVASSCRASSSSIVSLPRARDQRQPDGQPSCRASGRLICGTAGMTRDAEQAKTAVAPDFELFGRGASNGAMPAGVGIASTASSTADPPFVA